AITLLSFQEILKMKTYINQLTLVLCMAFFAGGCSQEESTQVERRDIIDAVFANGQLISSEEYMLTARAESYLLNSFVDEGDAVKKGMPLFVLSNESQKAQLSNAEANYIDAQKKLNSDSPQIRQLELQIAQAKTQLESDQKNFQRYEKLITSKAVSQVEYDKAKLQYENAQNNLKIQQESLDELMSNSRLNLQSAQTQLIREKETHQDFFLSSAIEGKVLNVYKTNGDLVRRGEAVAQIGGGEIILKLYIAEEDVNFVRSGQEMLVSLNTEPDVVHKARVSKIYPSFDLDQQSFVIEGVFEQLPEQLFPNTQIQANIIISEKKDALVIPTIYVMEERFVCLEDGSRKEIKLGMQQSGWTEVIAGLEEGQIICLPKIN
ncbi:MAG: efflux RND transporter periplasmic adaptor subunit, partial [Bacteroidota bacterium]